MCVDAHGIKFHKILKKMSSEPQVAAPSPKRSSRVLEFAVFAACSWGLLTLYNTVTRVEHRVSDLEAFADRMTRKHETQRRTQASAPPKEPEEEEEEEEDPSPTIDEVELQENEDEEEDEEAPSVSTR